MYIVIDTNIIFHACEFDMSALNLLTGILNNDNLKIGFDVENKLISEYRQNAGDYEFFLKWFQKIENSYKLSYLYVKLDSKIDENLTNLEFNGEVDKIVVALALNSKLKHIVTEDSDFGKGPRGDEHIDVLNYLKDDLFLKVHDATEAVEHFNIM